MVEVIGFGGIGTRKGTINVGENIVAIYVGENNGFPIPSKVIIFGQFDLKMVGGCENRIGPRLGRTIFSNNGG